MQPTITEGARAVVADAVARNSLGEDVQYDCWMQLLPTPQGMGVSLVVLLTIRGLALDERMMAPIAFGNPLPRPEEIDKQVQMTLTGMKAEKAKLVSEVANGTLPGAPNPNGSGS
jgi:hypothetical protein